ncbi:MAG: hypothetical protein ACPG4Z_02550 [Chitinophagales bacterium]
MKAIQKIALFFSIMSLLMACERDDYTPKQKAYPRVNYPERTGYTLYDRESCHYLFEYPNYAEIEQDTIFFEEDVSEQCWANIVIPSFNGKIHLSYKAIGKDITLEKVLEDSHEMLTTHTQKADYIDEYAIQNKYGVQGLMFAVGGDAATNTQFYMTDYENHYLRGALYFESTPNADSIAPMVEFVKEDMYHLFETFQWK